MATPIETPAGDVTPPPDDDDLVGRTLSETYELVRVLGEGGMGRVYEAQHKRIEGKRFAVKVLHREYSRVPEVLARFRREAEAAALIQSPHVAAVVDIDRSPDGRPFLVTELLQGEDLADLLGRGRMPVGQAVQVARQVCRALVAAHERGIVHRDIKPENVFLCVDRPGADPARLLVKVVDFGISRLEGAEVTRLTKTGMIIGTPAFMAPEQARGDRVDGRADVYAVGALLYTALTGRAPFDRPDLQATVLAVLTTEPPSPRSLEPSIPEALELVIQRAMAKEPERRYQSALELELALEPFEQTSEPAPPSARQGLRPPTQATLRAVSADVAGARPLLALLLAAAAIAAIAMLLGFVAAALRAGRARAEGGWGELTGSEAALILLGVAGAVATPIGLGVRYLVRTAWPSTARSVELLEAVRAPILAALAAYGGGALGARVIEAVLIRSSAQLAWPGWDVLLPLFGLGAGAATAWWPALSRLLAVRRDAAGASASAAPALAFAVMAGLFGWSAAVGAGLWLRAPAARADVEDAREEPERDAERAPARAEPATTTARATETPSAAPPATATAPFEARRIWDELNTHVNAGRHGEAIGALERLVALDPGAPSDPDVRAGIIAMATRVALLKGPEPERLFTLLASGMGSGGIDILYELVVTKGGTEAASLAGRLLADEAVRARGTPALRIAWEVRTARCSDKPALFGRAAIEGDRRTLTELRLLRNCTRNQACCLKDDALLKVTLEGLEGRLK